MYIKRLNESLDLSTPLIMGILNVTPDSFSDGGQFNSLESALVQARQMQADGARILDIGGESTRPGARRVGLEAELARVIPVIRAIRAESDVLISIDTYKPEVMRAAIAAGADMINDVKALRSEGAVEAAAELQVPVCLMHMQGTPLTMQDNPDYNQVVNDVLAFLLERVDACVEAGISREMLILDPGFGFGKTLEHNYQLLAATEHFVETGLPVLIGVSRKSMIGNLLNREVDQRLAGSLAAALIAAQQGAHIFRVHDVRETADVLNIYLATRRWAKNVNGDKHG